MRLVSVRLIISLIVGVTLVSLFSTYYEVRREKQGLRNELERRAEVLGESLVGNIEPRLDKGSLRELKRVVEQFSNREDLAGVAVFDAKLQLIAASSRLMQSLQSQSIAAPQAITQNKKQSQFIHRAGGSVHIYALPLHDQDQVVGELVIVHDASYINEQTRHAWRDTFRRVVVQVVVIALITLLIVRWSIAGPIARAAHWMKVLRTGRAGTIRTAMPDLDLLRPLAREMETLSGEPGGSQVAPRKKRRNYARQGNQSGPQNDSLFTSEANLPNSRPICSFQPRALLPRSTGGTWCRPSYLPAAW